MKVTGHERLFPHLPNADGNGFGRQMSRQSSTYIKARGVSDAGTIGHRSMDILPSDTIQHGISGSHYNLYRANQAPRNSPRPCKCFWQAIGAVRPDELPLGAVHIEPFAD
jgi:hypothetical protein